MTALPMLRAFARPNTAFTLGRTRSRLKRRVDIEGGEMFSHSLVLGTTGSGKTTAALTILTQAIAADWAVILIDLKGDPENCKVLRAAANEAGTTYRQFSITPGEQCDSWQPLAAGDPAARMSKAICLSEWTEPYYRTACERYSQMAFALMEHADVEPTIELLVALLDRPMLARDLLGGVDEAERERIERYLFGINDDKGQLSALTGFASRLGTLTDMAGALKMPTTESELDLGAVSENGGVVCFSLNSARSQMTAAQIGSLALLDVQSMVADRITFGSTDRPVLVCVDEFSALDADHVVSLFARARSSRVAMMLATQELSDLTRVRTGFCEQILGLTNTKLIMRQEVGDSADQLARLIGTTESTKYTKQTNSGSLFSARTGMGSERAVEEFIVHPNVFKRLRCGEAVLLRKDPFRVHELKVTPFAPGLEEEPS